MQSLKKIHVWAQMKYPFYGKIIENSIGLKNVRCTSYEKKRLL